MSYIHELSARRMASIAASLAADAAVDEEELRLKREIQTLRRARYGTYVDPLQHADFDHRGAPKKRIA